MPAFKPLSIAKSYALAFTPDSRRLLAVGQRVAVWNLTTGKRQGAYRPFAHPSNLDVAPSGTHCIVKSTGGELALMTLDDEPVITPVKVRDPSEGAAALFSPCGGFVVDAGWDGLLAVRELPAGRLAFAQPHKEVMIEWLACDPARERYAYVHHSMSDDDPTPPNKLVLRRWPFDTHPDVVLPVDSELHDAALAFSPDGRRLAINSDGRLLVVDADSGATLAQRTVAEMRGTGMAVAWSADGAALACVEEDQISFFGTGTLARHARHRVAYACDVAFSPDGRLVAMGSWENGVVMAVADLEPWGEGDQVAVRPRAEFALRAG